jgi:hypothetical protein
MDGLYIEGYSKIMIGIRITSKVALLIFGAILLAGCSNVGNAPAGGSADEVRAAFDKMPLEEQVKVTNSSSMPADKKKERIAELYKKAGKTPPDDGGPPAAPSGPPAGVGTPPQGGR